MTSKRSTALIQCLLCLAVALITGPANAVTIYNSAGKLGAPWMPKDQLENTQFYGRSYDLDNAPTSDVGDRFIFNQYDFSGVALAAYNPDGSSYGTKDATLISPLHFITAAHAHPPVGTRIEFRNTDGQTVSRTVTGYDAVGPDIFMGTFDTPFTPADKVTHYGIVADMPANVVFPELYDFGERYPGNMYLDRVVSREFLFYGGDGRVAVNYAPSYQYLPEDVQTEAFREGMGIQYWYSQLNGVVTPTGGDSGFCSFVPVNGELVIIGTHSTTTDDAYVPQAIVKLNQVMAGSGYQVTQVTNLGQAPTYEQTDPDAYPRPMLKTMPASDLEVQKKSNMIVGNRMKVGDSAIFVTSLGVQDYAYNGLASTHDVGIWSEDGTLLATATVPAGREAELDSDWRYVELDHAVRLEAGQVFYLGATTTTDDPFYYDKLDLAASDAVGGFLGGEGVLLSTNKGDGWQISANSGFFVPNGQWWPNFAANARYDVVPEPAMMTLFGLGALALSRRVTRPWRRFG